MMMIRFSLLFFLMVSLRLLGDPFLLDDLPLGADVTLLKPATTLVPLNMPVILSASDAPQTLAFKSHRERGQNPRLKLAIYDESQQQVKYADLSDKPLMYPFHGLGSIKVVCYQPDSPKQTDYNDVFLKIESDKPLRVGR